MPVLTRIFLSLLVFGAGAVAGIAVATPVAERAVAQPTVATSTVTLPPEIETRTVTETVYRTPAPCRKVISLAGKAFGVASGYPPLVAKAFEAGLYNDAVSARNIIDTMQGLNDDLRALTNPMRSASTACRNA